ncbi:MAG: arginase family protein, partial [Deinococcales bacterium]
MARISILGIPMDLGAGRRGVDMGPSALRLARLAPSLAALGHQVTDLGNVEVPVPEAVPNPNGLHYADAIAATCGAAYERLRGLAGNTFVISLGGDHSVSMGTIPGAAAGRRTGVVWV